MCTTAVSLKVNNDYIYNHNINMIYKLLKFLELLKLLKWVFPSNKIYRDNKTLITKNFQKNFSKSF
jgi:hypothetical protein